MKYFVLLVAMAIVAVACTSDDSSAPNSDGDQEIAPEFSVELFDGSQWSLSNHLAEDGRPVFLNLWASWCFPCREEMPAIDEASRLHPDVAFVGVAVKDQKEDAAAFAEEIGVTFDLGFDDGSVDSAYNPFGLPASYIISSEGVILESILRKMSQEDITKVLAEHFG